MLGSIFIFTFYSSWLILFLLEVDFFPLFLIELQIPIVIVGNKVDLADKRQISTEQGAKIAASLKCPFIETSTFFILILCA